MENDGFNLIYYHRVTGEAYRVKMVTRYDYVIEYPYGEKVRVTQPFLRKNFKACKTNNKRQRKQRLNFVNYKKENELN
jgi:hypothetical protein